MRILSGTGSPARGVGADGDFWVNTTTWTLHGPKARGAWPLGKRIWPDGLPRTFPNTANDVPLATRRGTELATGSGAVLLGDPPAR